MLESISGQSKAVTSEHKHIRDLPLKILAVAKSHFGIRKSKIVGKLLAMPANIVVRLIAIAVNRYEIICCK